MLIPVYVLQKSYCLLEIALILFFPQDTFASPPAVICEAHVALSIWIFSGDFVFSPTHFRDEATFLERHRTRNFCVILVILGAVLKERACL